MTWFQFHPTWVTTERVTLNTKKPTTFRCGLQIEMFKGVLRAGQRTAFR